MAATVCREWSQHTRVMIDALKVLGGGCTLDGQNEARIKQAWNLWHNCNPIALPSRASQREWLDHFRRRHPALAELGLAKVISMQVFSCAGTPCAPVLSVRALVVLGPDGAVRYMPLSHDSDLHRVRFAATGSTAQRVSSMCGGSREGDGVGPGARPPPRLAARAGPPCGATDRI